MASDRATPILNPWLFPSAAATAGSPSCRRISMRTACSSRLGSARADRRKGLNRPCGPPPMGNLDLLMKLTPARLILAFGALALLPVAGLRADPEYPKMGQDIFDVRADGSAQIASALAKATAEKKRVLL